MRRQKPKPSQLNDSNEPISPGGKDNSKLNAQKLGLYSTDVVITRLGETQEDYAACRQGLFQALNPEDAVEEAVCEDAVENFWRRQVRRSESQVTREMVEAGPDPRLSDLLKEPKGDDLQFAPATSPESQLREVVVAVSEKMSRAESRYDRRFYRAISTLYIIKGLKAKIGLAVDAQLPQPGGKRRE
jgi:hypothetical protein